MLHGETKACLQSAQHCGRPQAQADCAMMIARKLTCGLLGTWRFSIIFDFIVTSRARYEHCRKKAMPLAPHKPTLTASPAQEAEDCAMGIRPLHAHVSIPIHHYHQLPNPIPNSRSPSPPSCPTPQRPQAVDPKQSRQPMPGDGSNSSEMSSAACSSGSRCTCSTACCRCRASACHTKLTQKGASCSRAGAAPAVHCAAAVCLVSVMPCVCL